MADKVKDLDKGVEGEKDAGLDGGLEGDDVWGDVEDPLAELDGMTDEQIT